MTISDSNARIIVTLSKETKQKLLEVAAQEQRSMANLCSKIITDFLKQYTKEGD